MPKQTFYNLEEKKRNLITDAAKNEFSNHLLEEASINKIIKEANISRGSFYLYFDDINDLYSYIFDEYKKKLMLTFGECVEKNNGEIKQTFIDSFDKAMAFFDNNLNKDLIKNMFQNFHFSNPMFFHDKKIKKTEKIGKLVEVFNKYEINHNNKYLGETLEILTMMTMHSAIMYVIHDVSLSVVRNKFINKLNLIKIGEIE